MSFIEFLLEYYVYILSVLIILIVGVIGFLVDSKNKDKKKVLSEVQDSNVSNNNVVQGGQPQAQDLVVNNGQSMQMNAIGQAQMGSMAVSQAVSDNNIGVNVSSVVPSIEAFPSVANGTNVVQNMQPVMNNLGMSQMGNANVNNDVLTMNNKTINDVLNNVQSVQSELLSSVVNQVPVQEVQSSVSVGLNQIPVVNDNVDVTGVNNFNMGNEMNAVQSIQSVMPNMGVNQVPVSNVGDDLGMIDIQNNNMMNNMQNMQSGMDGSIMNQFPVHSVQNTVNMGVNQIPEENVNTGLGMGSVINSQFVMQSAPIVSTPVNNVPVMNNVDSNLNWQNPVMGTSNVPVQGGVVMNQQVAPNELQVGGVVNENVQSANVVGQPMNNNNLQNNSNTVFTSDGAQPFDISSMFANNQ